jgi:putative hydrolase
MGIMSNLGVFDFHTHTFLSDGVLSPVELIRRAYVNGYKVIAVTDHVGGAATQEQIIPILVAECALASSRWGILAIPGVELTHLPPSLIDSAARSAKEIGAKVVVVHGETIVEPVEEGTNMAALASPYVDILAHPGLLTDNAANLAAQQGTYIELSARNGHSLTNGHVARAAIAAGARLILDSDAHSPEDLLNEELARQIASGAGLDQAEVDNLLKVNTLSLLKRLGLSIS